MSFMPLDVVNYLAVASPIQAVPPDSEGWKLDADHGPARACPMKSTRRCLTGSWR